MDRLECFFCKRKSLLNVFSPFCPDCGGLMWVSYPVRKRKIDLEKGLALERFLDFLPLSRIDQRLSLGEGSTPLVQLNRIGERLRLGHLYAKNETSNPTSSFKDRGTAVAIQKAVTLGFRRIGTVSTGNMAASTAAYGTRAGLDVFVLLKEGTSPEKVHSTGIYHPHLISVVGDYGQLFYHSLSLGKKHNIYFMNSVDPYRIEGYKITGYEIFLQLDGDVPDYVLVPTSSGGHLIGLMKSFLDIIEEGYTNKMPRFVGIQAKGCSPLARAFASRRTRFKRIAKARTIAHALSNPDPPGGNLALTLVYENRGMIISVSDLEILSAQRMLAEEEGLFCQPGSATTLAGLILLNKQRLFKKQDRIALILTGSGLKSQKTLEALKVHTYKASLANLEKQLKLLLS